MPLKNVKKPRTRRSKKMVARRPRGNFKKRVLSVIRQQVETKEVANPTSFVSYNSGIDNVGDVNRVMPGLTQGVDDGMRIGSEVRLQSINIKGHLILNATNLTSSNTRIGVRIMVVTPKRYQHTTDAIANGPSWLPKLLKSGSTENGFTGAINNLYQGINTDSIICHYNKVYIMRMPVVNNYTLSGENTIDYPSSSVKFFNIKLRCKNRKLQFDETSNYPFGYGPVLIVGYCHLDGSAPDIVNTQLGMQYLTTIKYEDA